RRRSDSSVAACNEGLPFGVFVRILGAMSLTQPLLDARPARPASAEKRGIPFRLQSDFAPAGDQPQAIDALLAGVRAGERDQVLLGVTGSGKTFTIAHVIERA